MSFKIEQGLFGLDFTDYHAVLGVPLDAEYNDLRKRYLKIARRLHPDSCSKESEDDRKRAAEYLSKLVNPSYEKISQEKDYTEYLLLLKLKGQQARRQQDTVLLTSELSKKLAAANDSNIDSEYKATVRQLAEHQYEHLNQTLEVTGQLSELNLVYLMRKDGGEVPRPVSPPPVPTQSGRGTPPSPGPKPPPGKEELVEACLRRAQEYESKEDYVKAIQELRGALEIDPKSSRTYGRMGMLYLKSKQLTMAKIHFRKALELDPNDELAQGGMRAADPSSVPPGNSAQKGQKTTTGAGNVPPKKGGTPPKQSGGGLFGGIFGGKKK
jgi:curved DNA-binding protein CbpA